MKKVKLFEEFISETEKLVHVYQDGELYGTGSFLKKKGNKTLVGFDSEDERWFDNKDIKLVESETVYHQYDFLGMQAQAANMSREEWIAHYGTPEIGSGIDEAKKSTYTVFFDDRNGMDWDWEVEASSPEEAIKLVQNGDALGPYDQTLPRGARNFTAKLRK